jgi:FkbM family methyltransferase
MKTKENKFFVEIGTCDFDTCLPLTKNGWKGLMVEPVLGLLNNLPKTEGVIYDNCAVSDKTGETEVRYYDLEFTKDAKALQHWARGVGNIHPTANHFKLNRQWQKWERVDKVPCYTLDDLLTKHQVEKIDFLKLDCEGMDYAILKAFSFKIKPSVITAEIQHEDSGLGTGVKAGSIRGLLEKEGYLVVDKDGDNLTAIW